LGFSFLIEISQFYHPHWLDALRGTAIGGLILGFSFVWTDLICYTVGVVIGVILELLLVHRNSKLFSMS
ncbi:MAG: DUF2809 domain-containing protein, partial [Aliifodinibius sp.]|nr:DUF2809 domain-containing protein [Fodinibius sp.]